MKPRFIGRRVELEKIKICIDAPETRILCIEGEGGIGKTRLLHEIQEEFGTIQNLHFCAVIDFDDPLYHLPESIGHAIAQQLGPSLFDSYLDGLRHKRFLEAHYASPEYLARQSHRIEEEFLRSYYQAAGDYRIVLRFDATDNLRGLMAPIEYIAWLARHVPRTCLIVTGRNSSQVLAMSGSDQGGHALVLLEPLSNDECRAYLLEKLDQKLITLDDRTIEVLITLSRGRVILLDMAIEWLVKEDIPSWLREWDAGQLNDDSSLGGQASGRLESQLFDHVRALRTELDRLILLLSKIHPLDREGILELLGGLSDQDTQSLMQRARMLTFIKELPNGFLKLHDEAEHLVNKYVWTHIDPARARHTAEAAISYFEGKSKQLLDRMKQVDSIDLEYSFYSIRVQQLRLALDLDMQNGYKIFQVNWQLAEQYSRRNTFRHLLLDEVMISFALLPIEQQWKLLLLKAEQLIDEGQFNRAISECLQPVMDQLPKDANLYLVRILAMRGKAYTELGEIDLAVTDVESGLDLSVRLGEENWEVQFRLATSQLDTLRGHLDRAAGNYLDILRKATERGDTELQAGTLVKLAHVKNLQGAHESATHLVELSIKLWRRLSEENRTHYRHLGLAYQAAGIIHSETGDFESALNYLSLSSNTFANLGLEELRSDNRLQRGIVYWKLGKYEAAEDDLEWALSHTTQANRREANYYLAQVRWARGDRAAAERCFRECLSDAERYGDTFYRLLALCALSRLTFEHEMLTLSTWQDLQEYYKDLLLASPVAQFPALEGVFLTHLGHLAVKQQDYQQALGFYKDGLRRLGALAQTNYLGDFSLNGQCQFIHSKTRRLLDSQRARTLGIELETAWMADGLDRAHPEVMMFILSWKQS